MSKSRISIVLTMRSISTLFHVNARHRLPSFPCKALAFLSSAAAQRSNLSLDFDGRDHRHGPGGDCPQSPYGSQDGRHGITPPRDGFHGVGSHHNVNGGGNSREFYQTPHGQFHPNPIRKDNTLDRQFYPNPVRNDNTFDRQFHPNPVRNDNTLDWQFYPNPVRNDNTLDGQFNHNFYQRGDAYRNPGGFQRGNSDEFQREANGLYRDNTGQLYQNTHEYNRMNLRGEESNNIMQPKPALFNSGTTGFPSLGDTKFDEEQRNVDRSNSGESSGYKGTVEELDYLCKEGKVKEAVEVLGLLEKTGLVLDRPRYLCLLQACGDRDFLGEARFVHRHISQAMGHYDIGLYNKILDMYSNCGSMGDAYQLFDWMPHRNLTSWDIMIKGLADNGLGEEAIDLFTQFKDSGLRPDKQFFNTIFSVCGVLGAVDEGMLHFESMQKDFEIAPCVENYVGIVDMLGKNGFLDEAVEFIEKMCIEHSVDVWVRLMNLSRLNGDLELGDRCAEIVAHMDPSSLKEQAKKGLLDVDALGLAKGKNKTKSNPEVRRGVQEYRAGDRSHPEYAKFHEQVKGLGPQMKEAGYVPNIICSLHDIDHESREETLLYHSERLAIAYAVMTTPARAQIRIIKNLRVCSDCHNALKIISKLLGRFIVARDTKRFHHFQDGVCSCNDYW